jgi:hypothetical protein
MAAMHCNALVTHLLFVFSLDSGDIFDKDRNEFKASSLPNPQTVASEA